MGEWGKIGGSDKMELTVMRKKVGPKVPFGDFPRRDEKKFRKDKPMD